MSQILTLELSDRVFTAIQQQAETIGVPPERLAASLLEQQFTQVFKLLLTEAEKEVARARFVSEWSFNRRLFLLGRVPFE